MKLTLTSNGDGIGASLSLKPLALRGWIDIVSLWTISRGISPLKIKTVSHLCIMSKKIR
jgi:hypothetical protein